MTAQARRVRIERAVDHINRHYAQALSLDTLAGVACYSGSHFVRAFEAEVGEAPFELLRKRRLYAAAYRLLGRVPSGELLAEACGFAHASSFSRGFRQQFSMSARDWRHGGWQEWASWQGPDGAPNADTTDAEYLTDTLALPTALQVLQLPAQYMVYRRFRGVWGSALIEQAHAALQTMPESAQCYGVRHDLLHLRRQQECCFDLCVPLAPMQAVPAGLGYVQLAGGLYAAMPLPDGGPYLSWRNLLAGWPADHPYTLDPRRPMIEAYQRAQPVRCHTLYLPIHPHPR